MGRDLFYLHYCQTLILGPISPTPDPLFLGLPNLFLCPIQPDKSFVRSVLKEDIMLAIVGIEYKPITLFTEQSESEGKSS
jgi:hypothetical protein